MKKLAFIIALLITPFLADAQQLDNNPSTPRVGILEGKSKASDSNIFGHILDAATGEHIPYATVAVKGTTIGCAADATGHYNLNNLPVGEHTMVVSAIGYQTIEQHYTAELRRSNELNFRLEEQALLVDEVVVSATRNETNRRQTATVVNVASSKVFEGTASANLSEAMNFQSGLRVENTCGNCGAPQLRINGLREYRSAAVRSPPRWQVSMALALCLLRWSSVWR